jgi:branched-chain amino acid transport system permease protein
MGVIAVAIMLKAPGGVWGLISARYDLHLFPVSRRLTHGDTAVTQDQSENSRN